MLTQASKVQWQVLPSELSALLTEAELIRTYQPPYNILLKDDKSPLYISITNEKNPRVIQVRKKQLAGAIGRRRLFGPFSSAYQVSQVLKIARPIFRWCDNPLAERGCFYVHLDLCSGICSHQVSAEEYQSQITQLALFLRGKSDELLRELASQMKAEAAAQRFEAAARTRDKIRAITAVTKAPYLLKPDPQPLLLADSRETDRLTYLRRLLHLHLGLPKTYSLERIEGYDVSNISGTDAAVAMVCFESGRPASQSYRLFNIRTLNTPNDYQMMREALIRRQNHPEWGTPDLIVIDGGKGQLRAALKAMSWNVPIISIAKRPDRLIFPRQILENGKTKLTYTVVSLDATHPGLQLVQHIRDESHRFSKKQHHRIHTRVLLAHKNN